MADYAAKRQSMSSSNGMRACSTTRSIADLSLGTASNWNERGNGQRQTDVTMRGRESARFSLSPPTMGMTENQSMIQAPSRDFLTRNVWHVQMAHPTSATNFQGGDNRRRKTDVTQMCK